MSMAVRFLIRFIAVLACSMGLGPVAAADNAEFDLQLEYRVSWSNADIASATANWSFGDTSFKMDDCRVFDLRRGCGTSSKTRPSAAKRRESFRCGARGPR